MLRYKLRTLLIVLAVAPPVLAAAWWGYGGWESREREARRAAIRRVFVGEGGIGFQRAEPVETPAEALFDPAGPPDKMIQDWREPRP